MIDSSSHIPVHMFYTYHIGCQLPPPRIMTLLIMMMMRPDYRLVMDGIMLFATLNNAAALGTIDSSMVGMGPPAAQAEGVCVCVCVCGGGGYSACDPPRPPTCTHPHVVHRTTIIPQHRNKMAPSSGGTVFVSSAGHLVGTGPGPKAKKT